jgi:hypothetical protein
MRCMRWQTAERHGMRQDDQSPSHVFESRYQQARTQTNLCRVGVIQAGLMDTYDYTRRRQPFRTNGLC